MGFAQTKPALTGAALQWVTDHDDEAPFTNTLTPYRELIVSHPYIADAMDYDTHAQDIRYAIWAAIDSAETLGYVADVTVPADVPAALEDKEGHFTRPEAVASYAAKIAHAMYLEVNRTFPWRLNEYTEAELTQLLDPSEVYNSTAYTGWNPEGAYPQAAMGRAVDHSPKIVYDLILPFVSGATNTTEAISGVLVAGQEYHHSSGDDPLVAVTLDDSDADKIARNGCHHASPLFEAFCRAINIPATWHLDAMPIHSNVSAFTGDGDGYTLMHGDDLYSADLVGEPPLGGHPNVRRCMRYSEWAPTMLGAGDASERSAFHVKNRNLILLNWPNSTLLDSFIYSGVPGPAQRVEFESWMNMIRAGVWGAPTYTVQEELQNYADLSVLSSEDGLHPKPIPANIGTISALTPDVGQTLSTPSETYQDKDVTGTLTVTASNVTIRNCRIDGDGGVGIVIGGAAINLRLLDCELTNCSIAIQGRPWWVSHCYIHDCASYAIVITGPYAGASYPHYQYCLIDAGSSSGCVSIANFEGDLSFDMCSLVGTGSVPLVVATGTQSGGEVYLRWCWIDGGNYAISRSTTSGDFNIYGNQFGRTSTVGLYNHAATTQPTWLDNTYEDDGSDALQGDTAPL